MDVDLMMSTQDKHIVRETGGYVQDASQPSEMTSHYAASNSYVYYAPQVEHDSNAPVGESVDEALKVYEGAPANGYKVNAFTGYYASPSYNTDLPDGNYSATSLSYQSAGPVSSFPHRPSVRNGYNASVVQGQQQQISSYSGFNRYPHRTQDIGYSSNGSESESQGPFISQDAHQGHGPHQESLDYSMPAYEAINTNPL